MWTGEKGAVAASGQQFKFEIEQWRGQVAPKSDMAVELTLVDGVLVSLTPVQVSDVAMERFGQLSNQGTKIAQNIFHRAGTGTAIVYGLFAISALFLPFVSVAGAFGPAGTSISLPGVLTGVGNSGDAMGVFLVLIALASIAVPFFWNDRMASLSFCLPLLITLYGDFKLYQAYSTLRSQVTAMFGSDGNPFGDMIKLSLGLGAYATFITAAYIAIRGILQYMRTSTPQPQTARF